MHKVLCIREKSSNFELKFREIGLILNDAHARGGGGAVRVVPYAVTYPGVKSVLGHEGPKINLKGEYPFKNNYSIVLISRKLK